MVYSNKDLKQLKEYLEESLTKSVRFKDVIVKTENHIYEGNGRGKPKEGVFISLDCNEPSYIKDQDELNFVDFIQNLQSTVEFEKAQIELPKVTFLSCYYRINVNFEVVIKEDHLGIYEEIDDPISKISQNPRQEFKYFDEVDLTDITFNENFTFSSIKASTRINLSRSIFNSIVNFNNTEFEKTYFNEAKFKKSVHFRNTTFNDLVDFYRVEFHEAVQFFKTDFFDRAIFSEAKFLSACQFIYNRVESNTNISFHGANFIDSLDLSRSNFHCDLSFWNVSIQNSKELHNLYINDGDYYDEISIDDRIFAVNKLRETYRLIKDSLRSEGNNLDSSLYHLKELQEYNKKLSLELEELKGEKISYPNFFKRIRVRFDIWNLALNNFSNNHGTNYSRALWVTLIFTIPTFIGYLHTFGDSNTHFEFSFECTDIGNTLSAYAQFINISNWKIEHFSGHVDVKTSSWSYFVLFFSRLFIGYGIYQFIIAFRRYGKN